MVPQPPLPTDLPHCLHRLRELQRLTARLLRPASQIPLLPTMLPGRLQRLAALLLTMPPVRQSKVAALLLVTPPAHLQMPTALLLATLPAHLQVPTARVSVTSSAPRLTALLLVTLLTHPQTLITV